MTDRPDAGELLDAVRGFLEGEILPALTEARLRYQLLVAMHALSVVSRELPVHEDYLRQDQAMLAALDGNPPQPEVPLSQDVTGRLHALCTRIRAGDYDAPENFSRLASQLRGSVLRKLRVANPRYPGVS